MSKISYKDAGVDINKGNDFVQQIKPHIKATKTDGVIGGIGSFAGAFKMPSNYKNPVLLSATDGVGSKLKLAINSGKFDTVGIDLVAMCVNDIICNFGKPLFFLDYYATGKLDTNEAGLVVKGIADGCIESECALVGGETAEMPTMYKDGDFDLAGFCVGVAEMEEIDRTQKVKEGDLIIAWSSSGIHSNGFSLVHKILFDKLNMKFDDIFDGKKLIDILLEPTKIYLKQFLENQKYINALSHITGGGLVENIPRVLPDGLQAIVYKEKIKTPQIFKLFSKYVQTDELYRTFNMGVGMAVICNSKNAKHILKNRDSYIIGEITKGQKGCKLI
ncbi:MAG: phosphoribosylformylglycinamidine cyclo-ligase [Campylobacteraceae bacterium 4484_166]|nr:MAG: phosphoribosylformylglycinamidine cyclo-ligase [Campylobacteraceae bacterium 4484_166]